MPHISAIHTNMPTYIVEIKSFTLIDLAQTVLGADKIAYDR